MINYNFFLNIRYKLLQNGPLISGAFTARQSLSEGGISVIRCAEPVLRLIKKAA